MEKKRLKWDVIREFEKLLKVKKGDFESFYFTVPTWAIEKIIEAVKELKK